MYFWLYFLIPMLEKCFNEVLKNRHFKMLPRILKKNWATFITNSVPVADLLAWIWNVLKLMENQYARTVLGIGITRTLLSLKVCLYGMIGTNVCNMGCLRNYLALEKVKNWWFNSYQFMSQCIIWDVGKLAQRDMCVAFLKDCLMFV